MVTGGSLVPCEHDLSSAVWTQPKPTAFFLVNFWSMSSAMSFFRQFKQMDKDQTGTIDWWEFLNHEALKRIGANRSKVRKFFFLIF